MYTKPILPHSLTVIILILLLTVVSHTQNSSPIRTPIPFFQTINGNWRTDNGKSFGMKSTVALDCSTEHGGKFVRFEYLIVMKPDSATTQQFSGTGHYRILSDSTCDGVWCDSEGSMLPLRGVVTNNVLSITWGDSTTRQGRTIYQLQSVDTLVIIDSSLSKTGVMREFSRNTLLRR